MREGERRSAKEVEESLAGKIVELDDECKGVSRANYLEFATIQAVVAIVRMRNFFRLISVFLSLVVAD